MLNYILIPLSWLPSTLYGFVSTLIGVFCALLLIRLLKALWDMLPLV